MALSSGNIGENKFLTGKYVLLENDSLEKAATTKRFEYLPSGNQLKKQTGIEETQYQNLNFFEPNKKEEDKTKNKKSVLGQF